MRFARRFLRLIENNQVTGTLYQSLRNQAKLVPFIFGRVIFAISGTQKVRGK